jgi:hypothetical protein
MNAARERAYDVDHSIAAQEQSESERDLTRLPWGADQVNNNQGEKRLDTVHVLFWSVSLDRSVRFQGHFDA